MQKNVVKYDLNKAAIAKMADIYLDLTITDIEDKEQFDAVHSARMVVKSHRVAIEKERKSQKADALEYGRKVDAGAKALFEGLAPIELHLDAEEKKVTDEKKRIEAEKEVAERVLIQARIDALAEVGVSLPFFDVAAMDDDTFKNTLADAFAKQGEEKKRLADEEADRKAEDERLKKQKEEQEEAQKKIDEANAKLEREKEALEDAKQAERLRKDREAFEKQATENARIKAEIAEKKRQEQEVWDAKEKEEAEARNEAMKPDRDKLVLWGDSLLDLSAPELKDENVILLAKDTILEIYHIAHELHKHIEEL